MGDAVAWGVPFEAFTSSSPPTMAAITTMAGTAITTALWPAQIRFNAAVALDI
jgi:hypothetical protein